LTLGRIVLYFMDAKTMKKTTMPQRLHEKIEPYFK
jgi:acyl-CoA thioester hydrolase